MNIYTDLQSIKYEIIFEFRTFPIFFRIRAMSFQQSVLDRVMFMCCPAQHFQPNQPGCIRRQCFFTLAGRDTVLYPKKNTYIVIDLLCVASAFLLVKSRGGNSNNWCQLPAVLSNLADPICLLKTGRNVVQICKQTLKVQMELLQNT